MGFKCGLVGLPNAGKSTIFNAITNQNVEASSYPFCTIDPHFGIVPLEDIRLDQVYQIVGSTKKTPTAIEFVDIAGLVQGASKGEGLGNQFLSHIGRVDAIAHIIRCFQDSNVSHPYETIDPFRDAEIVTKELILKDIETIERRLAKSQTALKSGDSKIKKEVHELESIQHYLSEEKDLHQMVLNDLQQQLAKEMNLLTAKPIILVANVDEYHLHNSPLIKKLQLYARSKNIPCIQFCGKVQAEISELDQFDQIEFLQAMGLDETGMQKLVRAGYEVLNLITFFTSNENESHAWTITKGMTVQKAAGKVHSDFEKNFIKAEVIKTSDLIKHQSIKKLHDHGLVAIQGKEYIVQDGDLILFRIKK